MPRPLPVAAHLSVEELAHRYRQARDPGARSHCQMVWLLSQGQSSAQVAAVTGYCREWVRELRRRDNSSGIEALDDQRHGNGGQPPMLDDAVCEALSAARPGPAPDRGLWDSAKATTWLNQRLGRPVGKVQRWRWLRRLGWTPQHPRPRHAKGDVAAQAGFKKTSSPKEARPYRQSRPKRPRRAGGSNSGPWTSTASGSSRCGAGSGPRWGRVLR